MAVVGPKTRAALRKLEGSGEVTDVRVLHDRVRARFASGLTETWDLDGSRPQRKRLPRSNWWLRAPIRATEHGLLRAFDPDYEPHDDPEFFYAATDVLETGFLDQRLFVNRLARELATEGWRRPITPRTALAEDLDRVRRTVRRHALSTGFLRGQPGRPPRGIPPGLALCNELLDWGTLEAPDRPSLSEGWADPLRLRCAIDALLSEGRPLTRLGLIHRMTCGRAQGHSVKCGPRWQPVSLWISVLRDVLGIKRHPVILDLDSGCGSLAVATAVLNGAYIHPPSVEPSASGPLWRGAGEADEGSCWPDLVEDDGAMCADAAFVGPTDVAGLGQAVDSYGPRTALVAADMLWSERDEVLRQLPLVRVVRFKNRPFRLEERLLAIWRQQ